MDPRRTRGQGQWEKLYCAHLVGHLTRKQVQNLEIFSDYWSKSFGVVEVVLSFFFFYFESDLSNINTLIVHIAIHFRQFLYVDEVCWICSLSRHKVCFLCALDGMWVRTAQSTHRHVHKVSECARAAESDIWIQHGSQGRTGDTLSGDKTDEKYCRKTAGSLSCFGRQRRAKTVDLFTEAGKSHLYLISISFSLL